MIVCLGLNPALDITYRIDRMVRGEAQRVRSVYARAGGKATNVANVVTQLDGQAHLVCALCGPAGEIFARQLAETPIAMTGVESARPTPPAVRAWRRGPDRVGAAGDARHRLCGLCCGSA